MSGIRRNIGGKVVQLDKLDPKTAKRITAVVKFSGMGRGRLLRELLTTKDKVEKSVINQLLDLKEGKRCQKRRK